MSNTKFFWQLVNPERPGFRIEWKLLWRGVWRWFWLLPDSRALPPAQLTSEQPSVPSATPPSITSGPSPGTAK